jgi:hypothetical protein
MTEREALRLLHLDEDCSNDQLRRAYRDLVKVWHPDRFQSDAQLRAKAERTLQSINDAYALLQRRASGPASASAAHAEDESEPAAPRPDDRAAAVVPPSPPTGRFGRRLALAAAIGAALGVTVALLAMVQWGQAAPVSDGAAAEVAAPRSPSDVELSTVPGVPARESSTGAVRPESGADLLTAGERATGQLSVRNASALDAAVLLDGPSGARGFFLRRGEQVTLLDMAPGAYRVRVVFGASWTGRRFAQGATFFEREEPASVVGRSDSAEARPPLIVLDDRTGVRPTFAFALE